MIQETPLTGIDDQRIQVSMSMEEFIALRSRTARKERNLGKGLNGIMELLGCSKSKAYHIAHSDWFKPAIVYKERRFLSFDKDIAEELARKQSMAS